MIRSRCQGIQRRRFFALPPRLGEKGPWRAHPLESRRLSSTAYQRGRVSLALTALLREGRTMRKTLTLLLATLMWMTGCASEVVRRPTALTPATEVPNETIEILKDTAVSVGPGYDRIIAHGSVWTRIGHAPEGDVYKPVGTVFTVEGAQIHEAYLVLDGDRLVGFYLPVERAFSPASNNSNVRLPIQRR